MDGGQCYLSQHEEDSRALLTCSLNLMSKDSLG